MPSRKLLAVSLMLVLWGSAARAMGQDAPSSQQQGPAGPGQRPARNGRGDGPPPLVGKISAINGDSLELTSPGGTTVTVTLTDKTEFRKDRQPAKASDFKVGDIVFVRGEQGAGKAVTAAVVAASSGNFADGREGGRGFGGGGPGQLGELGKDYVAGEIKSIDEPKLTVLRPDNVTQTIELTEDSSLRKGRESITMAEIQQGDHVIARGAMQNNVFVPKNVMILSAEQWQRMQEMGARRRNGEASGDQRPNSPNPKPPTMNQPK